MKSLLLVSALTVSLATPELFSQCVQITAPSEVNAGQAYTLEWTPYAGANGYEIVTAFINGATTTVRRELVRNTRVTLMQIVSEPQRLRVTVTPVGAPTVCHESVVISIRPDETLRANSRRVVVPIVASAPGAFGAQFRSAVTISNTTGSPVTGRLVFHPAGEPASDANRSLPFTIPAADSLSWEDVVAAMGTEGVGSLDVIVENSPAFQPVDVSSLAINDGGDGRIWSAAVPSFVPLEVSPYQLADRSENFHLTIPQSGAEGRVNIGWRAVDLGTLDGPSSPTLRFSVYRNGSLVTIVERQLQQNEMNQVSSAQLLGEPLQPGDRVMIMGQGTVYVWATWTSNSTNDPAFIPARRLHRLDPVAIPVLPDNNVDVIPHESESAPK